MDEKAALALFDRQLRQGPPGVRAGAVVREVGRTAGDWSGVVWSGLDGLPGPEVDAVIAEQIDYFGALGFDFEWKLYAHDEPADLGDRLLAAGFTAEEPESVMVRAVAGLATDVVLPDGVELRPVTDAAGVELVMAVHDRAFGTDGTRLRQQLLGMLGDGSVRMAVVVADGVPVSSARIEFQDGTGFAGLWGGGTDPEWRGRGIYRALLAWRAGLAAERGVEYLQVDATEFSRPILERLGFVRLAVTTPYVYEAAR
ncbi:GNAT family N-acetyltransferase [Streptomyces sp. NPDC050504]|uniref:GNAT family N-acetyltransferase n=1 Tax=Streptomyces sp. NPDC050504 TaxID=3365618 RepID=UPI0037BB1159